MPLSFGELLITIYPSPIANDEDVSQRAVFHRLYFSDPFQLTFR